MPKSPCVYILASARNGILYVGVTSNLVKRIWEHKNNVVEGFTRKYGVRERAIKEWKRQWKLELIEKMNPEWRDLYPTII